MRKDAHPQYSFRSCTSLNSRGLVLCVRNVERTPLAISGMTLRSVYSRAGNAAMLSTEYWMFGKCEELVQNSCFYRAMRSGRTIILSPIEEKRTTCWWACFSLNIQDKKGWYPPAPKSRKQSAVDTSVLPVFQLGLGLAAFRRNSERLPKVGSHIVALMQQAPKAK